MKIIWGNVLRLLKTSWKPLSGLGWKKEARAASGNEWDQRWRCCLHFSRKLQQSQISKRLRKVKLHQRLPHQQLGWSKLVRALKQLNLEVDKECNPALFLSLTSSLSPQHNKRVPVQTEQMSKIPSEWGAKGDLSLSTVTKTPQITSCMQITCKWGLNYLIKNFPGTRSQMPSVHMGFLGVLAAPTYATITQDRKKPTRPSRMPLISTNTTSKLLQPLGWLSSNMLAEDNMNYRSEVQQVFWFMELNCGKSVFAGGREQGGCFKARQSGLRSSWGIWKKGSSRGSFSLSTTPWWEGGARWGSVSAPREQEQPWLDLFHSTAEPTEELCHFSTVHGQPVVRAAPDRAAYLTLAIPTTGKAEEQPPCPPVMMGGHKLCPERLEKAMEQSQLTLGQS